MLTSAPPSEKYDEIEAYAAPRSDRILGFLPAGLEFINAKPSDS
jgi:hypothetical protein